MTAQAKKGYNYWRIRKMRLISLDGIRLHLGNIGFALAETLRQGSIRRSRMRARTTWPPRRTRRLRGGRCVRFGAEFAVAFMKEFISCVHFVTCAAARRRVRRVVDRSPSDR